MNELRRKEGGPLLQAMLLHLPGSVLPGPRGTVGSAGSSRQAAGARFGQMGVLLPLSQLRRQLALPLTNRCLWEPK